MASEAVRGLMGHDGLQRKDLGWSFVLQVVC